MLETRRPDHAFPPLTETLWLVKIGVYRNEAVESPGSPHVDQPERRDARAVYERDVLPEVPVLLRVALSLTSQSADAHDLVQDTLLRAWRSLDTFDGRYPRSWLLTIMRNAQHNSGRRQRPDPIDLTDEAARERHASAEESAEEQVMRSELDASVAAALAGLSQDFREVIVAVDIDGLTYAEAAALLNVPEGTVMSRLHRARKRIRDRIVADKTAPLERTSP